MENEQVDSSLLSDSVIKKAKALLQVAPFDEIWKNTPISTLTLKSYMASEVLSKHYVTAKDIAITEGLTAVNLNIDGYKQSSFGAIDDGDCSLTSIAACLTALDNGVTPLDQDSLVSQMAKNYASVLGVAKWFGYHARLGTFPFFIKAIARRAIKKSARPEIKTHSRLATKWFGVDFLSTTVKSKRPTLFAYYTSIPKPVGVVSVYTANYGYYHRHSMVLVGMRTFTVTYIADGKLHVAYKKFLAVKDNWQTATSYIDVDTLKGFTHFLVMT